ncbi:hypothetical protein BGZ61DRAFT_487404 [Ilyonectria robusta]|uniref:uncharacterized protein n=1 Tax=Ilyonectria robusta TaxID=1079257 RepID=UPI001E8D3727|nr:uncharacterized protein BGZ61DRAFT_487404 [Ilyonectria robusta]KAH8652921.1 hypothetical protein BGZ61DRAFT_487404 [Ilyonectria robusta]
MSSTSGTELRWGVVGCGMISSWFVSDLMLPRSDSSPRHKLQAVGSSSVEKAREFVQTHAPAVSPSLYPSYDKVFNDANVDIVYIGTPHSCHFENAFAAIQAGKNVLCEKPLTINARQAESLITAAREKNVYLMETVWTRFFPIASALRSIIHDQKRLGKLSRFFMDFGMHMQTSSLPQDSRLKDPSKGAGALLDIGIYTLTWASIVFDQHPDNDSSQPATVSSSMTLKDGIDETTSIILNYPSLQAQAICTTTLLRSSDQIFGRIEGSNGTILMGGNGASKPLFLVVRERGKEEERLDFPIPPKSGFYHEQDAIAADLAAGRKESNVIPLDESLRIMRLMDSVRYTNGLRYPQDEK